MDLDTWFCAARDGKLATVQRGMAPGRPMATTSTGRTALMLAVDNDHPRVVRYLLPMSDVNATSPKGFGLLHLAVGRLGRGIVPLLLKAGADPHRRNAMGHTPLYDASGRQPRPLDARGRVEFAALLAVSDPRQGNDRGITPLMVAAGEGDLERTLALLPGSDVNAASCTGWTALMAAAMYGDQSRVQALLDAGANATACDHAGLNAAHAGLQGMITAETLDLLLERSSVSASSRDGTSALMWAAGRNDLRLLTRVLEQSDPNAFDEDGWSALVFALDQNQASQAYALCERMELAVVRRSLDMAALQQTPDGLRHEVQRWLVQREQTMLREALPSDDVGALDTGGRRRL